MFLWWLGGSDQPKERHSRSPRGHKESGHKETALAAKRAQQQEEDLVGLASLLRTPPARQTPPARSSSPSARDATARSTLESPTTVRRSKLSVYSVVAENQAIADDTRHALEQLAHRSDVTRTNFVRMAHDHAEETRAQRLAVPANRAAVQAQNRKIAREARGIHAEIKKYRDAQAKATQQWGKVNRYNEELQRYKVNQSRGEVASMRKKAAVQAIAQRHARREALAQEAQRALEGKQQLVAAVARETSPEVKAKSLGVVMGDRAEAADAIRREGEVGKRRVERAIRKPSSGKLNYEARQQTQEAVVRSVEELRDERRQSAAAMRESLREVGCRDVYKQLQRQLVHERRHDGELGQRMVDGDPAVGVTQSEWHVMANTHQASAKKHAERRAIQEKREAEAAKANENPLLALISLSGNLWSYGSVAHTPPASPPRSAAGGARAALMGPGSPPRAKSPPRAPTSPAQHTPTAAKSKPGRDDASTPALPSTVMSMGSAATVDSTDAVAGGSPPAPRSSGYLQRRMSRRGSYGAAAHPPPLLNLEAAAATGVASANKGGSSFRHSFRYIPPPVPPPAPIQLPGSPASSQRATQRLIDPKVAITMEPAGGRSPPVSRSVSRNTSPMSIRLRAPSPPPEFGRPRPLEALEA